MKLRYIIPLSLLCVFLLNGISYPEVSQYFDRDGNPLSAESRNREDSLSEGIQRYSIPEGIALHKDIRYEFYPVFGKTFSEIVRSAEENSPVYPKNKKRLPSKTDWTLGWTYKIDYSEDFDAEDKTLHVSAELYDIIITYDITITLPTLTDDTALNPAEKNLWKNYYLRLVEYEHDHAKIIRDKDTEQELRKKFSGLEDVIFVFSTDVDFVKNVDTFIEKETKKIGREWVINVKKRTDEYDRVTEYGFALQKKDSFFSRKER